jgi:hypothetical protein
MPPNVIVLFTDQQRWDTTGLHGNPLGLTPNFDRLAQQGTHLHTFTCQLCVLRPGGLADRYVRNQAAYIATV